MTTRMIRDGVVTKRDSLGNEREITSIKLVEIPKACKKCQKEPRAPHSSQCTKCSQDRERAKVVAGVTADRLAKKIDAQIKN